MTIVNVVACFQRPFWVMLEFFVHQVDSCHMSLKAFYQVERKDTRHLFLGCVGVPDCNMNLDSDSPKD